MASILLCVRSVYYIGYTQAGTLLEQHTRLSDVPIIIRTLSVKASLIDSVDWITRDEGKAAFVLQSNN